MILAQASDLSIVTICFCAAPGIIASVIGALVLRNQYLADKRWEDADKRWTGLESTVTKHGDDLKQNAIETAQIRTSLAHCKVECTREFVTAEQFVRESGFTRRTLEQMTISLSRLEGTLQVVNKIPEMAGQIANQIIKNSQRDSTHGN